MNNKQDNKAKLLRTINKLKKRVGNEQKAKNQLKETLSLALQEIDKLEREKNVYKKSECICETDLKQVTIHLKINFN